MAISIYSRAQWGGIHIVPFPYEQAKVGG